MEFNDVESVSTGTITTMSDDSRDEKEPEPSTTNLCISCFKYSRSVAFVPCAHYVTCLQCGHGQTECPVCKTKIVACVRIYE